MKVKLTDLENLQAVMSTLTCIFAVFPDPVISLYSYNEVLTST